MKQLELNYECQALSSLKLQQKVCLGFLYLDICCAVVLHIHPCAMYTRGKGTAWVAGRRKSFLHSHKRSHLTRCTLVQIRALGHLISHSWHFSPQYIDHVHVGEEKATQTTLQLLSNRLSLKLIHSKRLPGPSISLDSAKIPDSPR